MKRGKRVIFKEKGAGGLASAPGLGIWRGGVLLWLFWTAAWDLEDHGSEERQLDWHYGHDSHHQGQQDGPLRNRWER